MIEGIENVYPNYGIPKKKKYPLPDRKHVLSAIRFFNYVSPQDEKQLAEAILEKIKEYGMKDVGVGPDNRFLKYYKKDADHLQHHGVKGQQWGVHNGSSYPIRPGYGIKFNKGVGIEMNDYKIVRNDDCLQHHGIPGQKWGIRRFQNEDGSLTVAGRDRYGAGDERTGMSSYRQRKIQRLQNKLSEAKRSRDEIHADKTSTGDKVLDDAINKGADNRVARLEKKIDIQKNGNFYQRHSTGIKVAAGILAAGLAVVAISNVVKSANAKKGSDIVEKLLTDSNGYSSNGTVFQISGKKGSVSGYYSPEYAEFLRRTKGNIPGASAKNVTIRAKGFDDFLKRNG